MPFFSTVSIVSVILKIGRLNLKLVDLGWIEYFGVNNIFFLIFSNRSKLNYYLIKNFLFIFFLIFLILIFGLFLYLINNLNLEFDIEDIKVIKFFNENKVFFKLIK